MARAFLHWGEQEALTNQASLQNFGDGYKCRNCPPLPTLSAVSALVIASGLC